ncbi:transporter, YbiR family [Clostridium sp. DSM 8431]|uniref:SLC13 family permease n=1 Tax=Clostridium sp. DSM 8431 TaxID=1761781 RepID=UPI0008F18F53|nr:SLC13 family permease [Clostridium sp. DSM 8431]SFU45917.1 transporter, YbiR family [Clostridium sp. DSM 8431]
MTLNLEKPKQFAKQDPVLMASFALALISSIFTMPKLEYIDFRVLILLFNLMIIVAAFKNLKIFDALAVKLISKCRSYRSISFVLIFITFLSSMFITNDVSLITFVPLTIIVCNKANIKKAKIIVFQTLAANLGSSFTPMGNPQNLYIYSYYNIGPIEFFKITLPLLLISILFIGALIFRFPKEKLSIDIKPISITSKKHTIYFFILFIVILLSVFHIADYRLIFIITILVVFLIDKDLFKEVDYTLLLTFIFFYIFIGNVSSFDYIKNFMINLLSSKNSTFFSSIILSQVISNVPCTMLLSSFTSFKDYLLLGVNIGGLGTLIASMASLISYKLYNKEDNEGEKSYIHMFTFYNILGLLIITPLVLLLINLI